MFSLLRLCFVFYGEIYHKKEENKRCILSTYQQQKESNISCLREFRRLAQIELCAREEIKILNWRGADQSE